MIHVLAYIALHRIAVDGTGSGSKPVGRNVDGCYTVEMHGWTWTWGRKPRWKCGVEWCGRYGV